MIFFISFFFFGCPIFVVGVPCFFEFFIDVDVVVDELAESWVFIDKETKVKPIDSMVKPTVMDFDVCFGRLERRGDSVFNDSEWDCCFDFDAEDKNFGFRIDDFSFETVGDISCFDGVEVGFYDGVVGVADFDGVAVGDDGFFEGKECFADSCFSVDRFRPFFEHDVDLDVI